MPTKPILTYELATDAIIGTGPAAGFDTKIILPSLFQGFVPGTGASAQQMNYPLNIAGDWITNWLLVGTFDPDEDAHVVESDSDGLVSAALAAVTGTAAATTSLVVTGGTGLGAFIDSTTGTTGVDIASGTTGINVVSGANGMIITATDTGLVVLGDAGATITATVGRGVTITTLDTNPAPLRLIGRDQPTGPALGDIYVDDATNLERLRVRHSGVWNSVWTTPDGFARAFDTDRTESSTSAGGFGPKVTAAFVAGDGLVSGATVHVRATCEIGQSVTTGALNLRIRDTTAAADVIASEAQHANSVSTAANEKMVTLEADYTLPGSGARSIALEFESNGVATVYIRRASMEVTGQY